VFNDTFIIISYEHYFADSVLSFSLTVLLTASLTIFVQSPWSRLCCIRLFKFVIITLHYITFSTNRLYRATGVWNISHRAGDNI